MYGCCPARKTDQCGVGLLPVARSARRRRLIKTCLKAQLDSITNASGPPDLSALDGAERDSMESACAGAKRLHGSEGYNRYV